jgi:hypothetical protein
MKRVHNQETNEVIDAEMTDAEYQQFLAENAAAEAKSAAIADEA